MDMIMGTSADTELNHRWYRDDKKRKAFKRGGPEKPKEQPKYEKDFQPSGYTSAYYSFLKRASMIRLENEGLSELVE